MAERPKPVVIELEDAPETTPADAPPVPELPAALPDGKAMQAAMRTAGRRASPLARWFWRLLVAALGFGLSVWTWDWATRLIERSPVLGGIAVALLGALVLVALGLAIREIAAFGRLKRLDRVQARAAEALDKNDLDAAGEVANALQRLYANRADLEWQRARFAEGRGDILDADALLGLAEAELIAPLDAAARREIEAASRQVAAVTAIVPLALADVAVALAANLRMIRRIAEVYGGQSGALGSWRLARSVMAHLVATGAVAIGDDMIGSVAGGGVLSKLSRRFGEGVINGALTARVGLAAMELCRPLPFVVARKPTVSGISARALAGLFGGK